MISFEARAHCRVGPIEVCAWNDRQPDAHGRPGPGEPTVEVLERTDAVCVYRVTRAGRSQTTRRVRVAPNRWISDRSAEQAGVGRFHLTQTLTVMPEGSGSLLKQVTEMWPEDRRGSRSARIAQMFRSSLERSSRMHLAAMALDVEAERGLAVDPRTVLGRETAGSRLWARWTGVHSQYRPRRDWAGAVVLGAGVAGVGLAALLLAEGIFHAVPPTLLTLGASLAAAAVLIVVGALVLALLMDRWRTIVEVEALPSGVVLRTRLHRTLEVAWPDLGLWGMRPEGERYLLRFRDPRLGPENQLRLTRDHARAILSSPSCPTELPPSYVLAALDLRSSAPAGPRDRR